MTVGNENERSGDERERLDPSVVDPAAWRDALLAGRFSAARRAVLEASAADAGGDGATLAGDRLELVGACERVAQRLLDKEYAAALRPLEEIGEGAVEAARRAGIALAPIRADAEALREAGRALDEREPDLAREKLAAVGGRVFAAEADALRGTIAVYDGDVETAEAAFRSALEIEPEHVRALTNLGNLALEAGRIDEAIARYEEAIAVDDDFANAHHNLGVALRKRGQIGRSVKALRTAQRVSQRRMRQEARRELSQGASSRWIRRALIAVVAVAALLIYLRISG